VTISGRQDVADLLNGTKLGAGDRFDFFEWQRDRERIETRLRDAGYLQSQVSARRQLKDGAAGVTLEYEVRRGPKTTLSISGYPLSGDVVRDLSAAWSRSVDDVTLLADLRDRTRAAMIDEGYFAAKIDSARRPDDRPGEKTVVITIVPGTRTESRRLSYVGNKAISAADLDKEVERRRLDRVAWTDPGVLGPALLDFYRSSPLELDKLRFFGRFLGLLRI
jgi:outer membrane protein assembly factor BamA